MANILEVSIQINRHRHRFFRIFPHFSAWSAAPLHGVSGRVRPNSAGPWVNPPRQSRRPRTGDLGSCCHATTGGNPLEFESLATGPVGSWPRVSVGSKLGFREVRNPLNWLLANHKNLSAGKWKVPIHACRQDRLDGCSPVHFWWSWVVPQSYPKCQSSKALKNGWLFFLLNINCAMNDPLVPKWTAHLFIPFCSLARALPCTKRRSLFQQPG